MPKIRLLPPQVSELIAAGEVVERPSSVVKELLENAIDAKATAITVELKEGGIRYLRVTDNGVGIAGEDVPTAFLRHATSKLEKRQDLEQIATLGFRGEALASIAAVAKVELLTKTLEEKLGTRANVQGGGRVHTEAVGCPEGTTVVVRDLFYNLPARLKFLKKTATEAAYVVDVVEKLALSHPEISFRLIKDNKSLLHTPGDGKLLSAVYTVLGREFAAQVREVDYTYNNIRLTGLITRPSYTRANRKLQIFFVNQRYVRSGLCMQALQEAYQNEIMVGRFPACVLELTLPYASVDVNVHPAKTEIKFIQDSSVYECIYFGVKSALSAADELTPPPEKKPLPTHPPVPTGVQQTLKANQTYAPPKPAEAKPSRQEPAQLSSQEDRPSQPLSGTESLHCPPAYPKPKPEPKPSPASSEAGLKQGIQGFSFLSGANFSSPQKPSAPKPQPAPAAPEPDQAEETPPLRYIGEVFQTYLLLEAGEQLIVMDKHAAHERIRYEQLRSQLSLDCAQALVPSRPLDPDGGPAGADGGEPFPLGGVRPAVWADGRGNLPDRRPLGAGTQSAFPAGGGDVVLHCRRQAGYFPSGLGTAAGDHGLPGRHQRRGGKLPGRTGAAGTAGVERPHHPSLSPWTAGGGGADPPSTGKAVWPHRQPGAAGRGGAFWRIKSN